MAISHAYDYVTFFSVVLPVIEEFNGKWVFKHFFRQLETDSVFGVVVLRFWTRSIQISDSYSTGYQ